MIGISLLHVLSEVLSVYNVEVRFNKHCTLSHSEDINDYVSRDFDRETVLILYLRNDTAYTETNLEIV